MKHSYDITTGQRLLVATGEHASCLPCQLCDNVILRDSFAGPLHPSWLHRQCAGDTAGTHFTIVGGKLRFEGSTPSVLNKHSITRQIQNETPDDFNCISLSADIEFESENVTQISVGFAGGPRLTLDPVTPRSIGYLTQFDVLGCPGSVPANGSPVRAVSFGNPVSVLIQLQRVGVSDDWHVCFSLDGVEHIATTDTYASLDAPWSIVFRSQATVSTWVDFDNLEVRVEPRAEEPIYAYQGQARRGLPPGLRAMVDFYANDPEIGALPRLLDE